MKVEYDALCGVSAGETIYFDEIMYSDRYYWTENSRTRIRLWR